MIDFTKMTGKLLRDDPVIENRIRSGIAQNRKGGCRIILKDRGGNIISRAGIRYRQISHAFHFGCNAFLMDAFDSVEKNAAHDKIFADMFNLAVVPFYWDALEPERGKYRYAADSPRIYRRPPPDMVTDFCAKHNITPKGHVLCWNLFLPQWLEKKPDSVAVEMERRFSSIAGRYGEIIRIWDVANEAVGYHGKPPMPEDHVRFAFELAGRYFPRNSKLMYNDNNWSYHGQYSSLYLLLRYLQTQGCRLGGLGLQYHMFVRGQTAENLSNDMLDPYYMYRMLDLNASAGIPIDLSEVTILGSDELGDGETLQSLMLEKMYRIWFSHPAVESIIYWNLVDDCAFVRPDWNENIFKGGLLNSDLTPKKAFQTLRRLIKEEWHSAGTLDYEAGRTDSFCGFHGDYELEIHLDGGTVKRRMTIERNMTPQLTEIII